MVVLLTITAVYIGSFDFSCIYAHSQYIREQRVSFPMDVLAIRTLGQKVDVAAIPVPLAVESTVPIVLILLNAIVTLHATF